MESRSSMDTAICNISDRQMDPGCPENGDAVTQHCSSDADGSRHETDATKRQVSAIPHRRRERINSRQASSEARVFAS